MMRASPAELRKAMEAATAMMKAGILFIPMPVLNPEDFARLQVQAMSQFDRLAEQSEAKESDQ